jgi:hypothetical protein
MWVLKLRKLFGLRADSSRDISPEEDVALRERLRIIQEQKKQAKHNFGNAGGLNSPTDFNRGFGGRAVDDHLNRSPKDNP